MYLFFLFALISSTAFIHEDHHQNKYSIESVKEDDQNHKPDKILNLYHVLILNNDELKYAYYCVTNVWPADAIVAYYRPLCLHDAQMMFPEYEIVEEIYVHYEVRKG